MKIMYSQGLLETMRIFSQVTHAALKDCFEGDEGLYFVVEKGELGKAIGKGGIMVKKLQDKFGKKVKVIEFDNTVEGFIRNMLYPLKVDGVSVDGEDVVVHSDDRRVKGLIIGRNAKNLNTLSNAVKRYFTVESVKVE